MSGCNDEKGAALGRLITPSRNSYFYGKRMDVCHFEMEQTYFNRKRWLINRLVLGSGVVSGLGLALDEDKKLELEPGVAIDRLGREIIVPSSVHVDYAKVTDELGRPTDEAVGKAVWIYLAYHECLSELVPVRVGDCETTQGCAPSTICEHYRILVLNEKPPQQSLACPGSDLLVTKANGCITDDSRINLAELISKVRLADKNDTDGLNACVPLARIDFGNQVSVHNGVRSLVFGNELLLDLLLCQKETDDQAPPKLDLPVIVGMEPVPDTEYPLASFLDSGIKVRFNKEVAAQAPDRIWFIVTVEKEVDRLDPKSLWTGVFPSLRVKERDNQQGIALESNDEGTTALFMPDLSFGETAKFLSMPLLCRVVLKCNFLRDKSEPHYAVDGDYFGGPLDPDQPTGDGVQGGDFESWFYLRGD